MSLHTEKLHKINGFFESYANALERFDARMMANHYSIPATFISDDKDEVYSDATKLEGLLGQALAFYKRSGLAHARPEVWSKRVWTDRIIKAKVNWQYFDAQNHPVYDCDYQYILKLDKNDRWKIIAAISLNEKERMEDWQHKQRGVLSQ
jgi:hypothetical protein